MRLSVNPEPGFRQVNGWRVTMDGRQLGRVFKVDTCTGVAWVADTDKDGQVRIDRRKREVLVRKIFGPMRAEPMH